MSDELIRQVVEEASSLDEIAEEFRSFDFYMNFCVPYDMEKDERLPRGKFDMVEVNSYRSSYPWIPKRILIVEETFDTYEIVKFSAGTLDRGVLRRDWTFKIGDQRLHSVVEPIRVVLRLRPGKEPGRWRSVVCGDYADDSKEHAESLARRVARGRF